MGSMKVLYTADSIDTTIHSTNGLAFPTVIFSYHEWFGRHKDASKIRQVLIEERTISTKPRVIEDREHNSGASTILSFASHYRIGSTGSTGATVFGGPSALNSPLIVETQIELIASLYFK